MNNRHKLANSLSRYLLLLAALALMGCLPSKKLPEAGQLPFDPHGSLIQLRLEGGGRIEGELIVATADTLFILQAPAFPERAYRLSSVPVSRIGSFQLHYARGRDYSMILAGLGGVSLLTHGWFLFLTVPANMLAGGLIAHAESREYTLRSGKEIETSGLSGYARFPQGFPPGIDRREIQ